MKNLFGKILIGLGAAMIALALYWHFDAELQQKRLLADYELLLEGYTATAPETPTPGPEDPLQGEPNPEVEIVEQKPEKIPEKKPGESNTSTEPPKNAIGILAIPKINLRVVVQKGVTQSILNYAVGHFPETALPGEKGNFAVIGHRNYAKGQFFNRLDEVEVGDLVNIRSQSEEFVYEVTESFLVLPHEVWVLDGTGEAEITMITCAPARRSTHRLIVKGRLLETT